MNIAWCSEGGPYPSLCLYESLLAVELLQYEAVGKAVRPTCEKTGLACSSEVVMYQTSERWGKELITVIISKALC